MKDTWLCVEYLWIKSCWSRWLVPVIKSTWFDRNLANAIHPHHWTLVRWQAIPGHFTELKYVIQSLRPTEFSNESNSVPTAAIPNCGGVAVRVAIPTSEMTFNLPATPASGVEHHLTLHEQDLLRLAEGCYLFVLFCVDGGRLVFFLNH